MFPGGMQEDLVVFSDEYFESLEITEGPTLLYLINAKEGASKEIEKGLDIFAGRHGKILRGHVRSNHTIAR